MRYLSTRGGMPPQRFTDILLDVRGADEGADILRTAIAPDWDEIGKLAAIATLRTVLNFFLQREMEHAQRAMR